MNSNEYTIKEVIKILESYQAREVFVNVILDRASESYITVKAVKYDLVLQLSALPFQDQKIKIYIGEDVNFGREIHIGAW